ncbi:MAG: fibronectin type III domain-containing protein [Elusimicrobia bacterium]|nr:fibronectin type III domain-containing protein [Elusimicrobiota bacterium]
MTLASQPVSVSSTFTNVGNTALTTNWTACPGTNAGYIVQISTLPGITGTVFSSSTLNTSAAFTGLFPGVIYYARVASLNALGAQSDYTALDSTMTVPAPALPPAPPGTFSTGQNASLVIGQSDFTTRTSGVSAAKLTWPRIAFDASGNLWVSDEGNQRILRFAPPFSNGMSADLVLGQADFISNAPGLAANKLNTPTNLAFDAFGNLWAVDYGNHRVLRFSPPLSTGMSANLVLGQGSFTTNNFATTGAGLKNPYGATVDESGNLWVADKGNNRVLRFSPPFSNGMAAGLVLGQAGFTAGVAALSAAGLDSPLDVKIDASGRLWVADYGNNRALRYTPPFASGMSADLVVGQPDFNSKTAALSQSGLNASYAVSLDSASRAWVLDRNNNRALRFSPPFSSGMNADLVLGQADFISSAAATTQNGLRLPLGLALDSSGNLWVAEEGNSRAVRFSQAAGAAAIETVDAGEAAVPPLIAVDAQNNLHVAYTELSGATRKVKHIKRTGGAWGAPTIVDAGPNIRVSDLAIDSLGNPHVCYGDGVLNTVKYSSFTGTAWTSPQTVDTGALCTMVVDAFNKPRVAYQKGGTCSDYLVYYATSDGNSWSSQALSAAGFEGGAPSLALDAAQNPHIAYRDRICFGSPGLGVRYAKFDGAAWSVQTPGFPHGDGGSEPNLALDGAGRPRLAHGLYGSSDHALYYASFNGSSWSNQLVDDPAVWRKLALDGSGNPHIAYSGGSYNLATKYASSNGVSWSTQAVAADAYPSIVIDAAGDIHFAYADGQLKIAHLTGLGLPPPMGGNARGRAQAPGGFQASAIYQTSVAWSWTDNSSNELGFAIYGSQVSTGPYVLVAGTATIGAGQGSFTETGLSPGTTCYRYVVAVATGGTVASNADSATPNLAASPAPPAAPAGFAGSVLGTSSISWNWSDVTGETGYRVKDSSGNSLSGDLPANTISWVEMARTPNTSYARRVVAFGAGGASPPSSDQTVVTFAAKPGGLQATAVASHTITLSWSANNNPSGTPYELSFSDDGFLTRFSTPIAFSAGYAATTASVFGLSASTNYSFRVRARNDAGVSTDFSPILSTTTLAPPADITPPLGSPSTPTDDGAYGNSLVFRWTLGSAADPESGMAGYHLQVGFSPGASEDFDGDVGNVLVWTRSTPVNGQTYYARVCAKNGVGLCGAYSASSDGITIDLLRPIAPSFASPSHPESDVPRPVAAALMQLTGPGDMSQITGYYYAVDGLADTVPNNLTGTFSAGLSITTNLLADGTWYFHVVAKDGAGNIGTQAAHYKFIVMTAVSKDQPNDLLAADGTRVEIPAGALLANTAIVISTPPAPPAVISDPSLKSTPVVRDIKLADGTRQLLKEVVVTLPYAASDVAGLDERSLRLFFHNEASQTWELISNSVVDTSAKRVTGRVTHFTLFRILGFQASGGLSLSNYPNPFSPLRGQTTRIRYTLGQDGPVRIRIYDSFGSPVWDGSFAAGDAGGKAGPNEVAWDGRTGSGRMTEAGTYICVVDAGGQRGKTRIVAK